MSRQVLTRVRLNLTAMLVAGALAVTPGVGTLPAQAATGPADAFAYLERPSSTSDGHYREALALIDTGQPEVAARVAELTAAVEAGLAADGTRPVTGGDGTRVLGAAASLAHVLHAAGAHVTPDHQAAQEQLYAGSELLVRTALADAQAALADPDAPGLTDAVQDAATRTIRTAQTLYDVGAARTGNVASSITMLGNSWGKVAEVFDLLDIGIESDVDDDGLSDLIERVLGTNPLSSDTDGDGLSDWFEAEYLLGITSPFSIDSDEDGVQDGADDLDNDELTALEEQDAGTSPAEPDTDHDGLLDGDELAAGTDPLAPDSDGDTLPDGQEPPVGLNPALADTDGDGVRDDAELVSATTSTPAGVTIELTGTPAVAHGVTVVAAEGPRAQIVAGMLGHAWEIQPPAAAAEAMTAARLTLPVPANDVPTENLAVFTYDATVGSWVPTGEDLSVSPDGRFVSVTVDHFSLYAVFDIVN